MFVDHSAGLFRYLSHGITNALAESINALIVQIKRTARGFRVNENFRISVLFYFGKLDLSTKNPINPYFCQMK
jgi:transposase